MKAIETRYNGYRFRSRLEARWAVFFDTLGIKYEYEPEGFDLTETWKRVDPNAERLKADQVWYLPDFFLPDYKYYVEIKATGTLQDQREAIEKCFLFSLQTKLLLIIGTPGNEYVAYRWPKIGGDYSGPFVFAEGRKCNRLWITSKDSGQQEALNCDNCDSPKCGDKTTTPHAYMDEAYRAARSARF